MSDSTAPTLVENYGNEIKREQGHVLLLFGHLIASSATVEYQEIPERWIFGQLEHLSDAQRKLLRQIASPVEHESSRTTAEIYATAIIADDSLWELVFHNLGRQAPDIPERETFRSKIRDIAKNAQYWRCRDTDMQLALARLDIKDTKTMDII